MNTNITATAPYFPIQTPYRLLGAAVPHRTPMRLFSEHFEAINWRDRVVARGDSVSQATLAAVSEFCYGVDACGLRASFYRLSLMCGNGLTACLTPLYRGPVYGGTTFGNAGDTNVAFVSSDYVESVGLLGDGSNKYLSTGLTSTNVGASGHSAVYTKIDANAPAYSLCGTANASHYYVTKLQAGGGTFSSSWGGNNQNTATARTGLLFGSRINTGNNTANSAPWLYSGGEFLTNSAGSGSPGLSTSSFFVFGESNTAGTINTATGLCNNVISAYSFGMAMTGTQVRNYTQLMRAFQATLGRYTG